MGREHHWLGPVLCRDFVQLFDEDRTLGLQPFHHITVMNNLVPDIDRSAILLQSQNNDLDGAIHTGTKTARTAKADGDF